MKEVSTAIEQYFRKIDLSVKKCYSLAEKARSLGLDPEPTVPILLAKNMAERVVGLISVVAPQIAGVNIPRRIQELEKQYGQLDWRVGFKIAEEVAKQNFCSFANEKEAIEVGLRVGFAYLTLGIVSAPLEGLIGIKIKQRRDGKNYLALQYAGPIRAAGGTAASTSVILADYVRIKMGYSPYDPDKKEILRALTEVNDYHDRVTNLQYLPSAEELEFMVSNLPVEVDGDPTENLEVSNYKDLLRIDTNFIRGGIALVLAEGLCQKAPKLWKRLSKWGKDFDLEWGWLEKFLELKEKVHSADAKELENTEHKKFVKANNTFIMDLVAGRPILTHPLAEGGFRLRYGRGRTSGFSAASLHPATLIVLDKYIAIGTQLKVERPGKAATVTVCDTIEGPIVRLKSGTVCKLNTEKVAKELNNEVEEVIFLGDILFNYGDFSENGQSLVPAGYCPEWWALEVLRAKKKDGGKAALKYIEEKRFQEIIETPLTVVPTLEEAKEISQHFNVPLHPDYTFYWKLVKGEDILLLSDYLGQGRLKKDSSGIEKIILPYSLKNTKYDQAKRVLELLGVPHLIVNKESLVMQHIEAEILALSFNFYDQCSMENVLLEAKKTFHKISNKDGLSFINAFSSFSIRDKAGTFIGARMGRPEKAKMRHLTGSPQVLFPVGEEGDRLRSFQAALQADKVRSTFPLFFCSLCKKMTIYGSCENCGAKTEKKFYCRFCGDLDNALCRHGKGIPYKTYELDIKYYFEKAKEKIGMKIPPDLIKGIRGTSNKEHIVEHLSKGLLRSKHGIYVNKDGTTRYDCTELPLTHFKPKEIGTSIETLKSLGYTQDISGKELVNEEQILELFPQDIILPGFDSLDDSAQKVLTKVANFVDDLLVSFYGMKAFYEIKKQEDLVGHLVIGLAPHISAGLIGRIIGFSETQGLITHPMYHAGMRRDCDGDEACVILLMDALLNFSRQYLPEKRGAKTMDAPLVLTSLLNPAYVDDQVHGIDVVWRYPLEFYEAALEMKYPWEVKYGEKQQKIEQLGDRLGTPAQYESFGFTHLVDNFNKGVCCSAYKIKPTMTEKLLGQMEIAKKVRAVDLNDVARLVIQKHLLKDIKGNLRKFSMQRFRCLKCNEKFRRPPLSSRCSFCQGKLLFTVSEGSVVKYLEPSLVLAEKYDFSPYLKQTLQILKTNIDQIFGKEREKQIGLGEFMTQDSVIELS